MQEIVPLFPLNLVVFPDEYLHLHIFEPRYKQLVRDASAEESFLFGIPPFLHKSLKSVGTSCALERIYRTYDDGRMDIGVRGVSCFTIEQSWTIWEDKLYGAAEVRWLPYELDGNLLQKEQLLEYIKALYELTKVEKEVPLSPLDFKLPQMVHYLGLSLDQEYELLCMEKESEQIAYLIAHIQNILPAIEASIRMRDRVAMNGHFKYLDSPLQF